MKLLRRIVGEFVGMFVDDWQFALALAVLVLGNLIVVALLGAPALPAALVLLVGCIGLLAWSVVNATRKARDQ